MNNKWAIKITLQLVCEAEVINHLPGSYFLASCMTMLYLLITEDVPSG